MSIDRRIDKLYPALTARERAVLVLQAMKEDREEDSLVRSSIPESQIRAYNRYVRKIRVINHECALALDLLGEQVTQVELKHGWFMSLALIGDAVAEVADYISTETTEPITESGLRARTEALRRELLTVAEAAERMTEQHDWDDNDLDAEDDNYVTPAAWERVRGESEAKIRRAIAVGMLAAQGEGARARIEVGDLHDWLGVPVDATPTRGPAYEVRPDAESEDVARALARRERVRRVLRRITGGEDWPLDLAVPPPEPDHDDFASGLAVSLVFAISQQLAAFWAQLQAIETIVAEVSEELGENVMLPDVRRSADALAARMRKLAGEIGRWVQEFTLPLADEELVMALRGVIERDG